MANKIRKIKEVIISVLQLDKDINLNNISIEIKEICLKKRWDIPER